ncbi:DNA-binding transcriptional regulator, AcrR family [Rhodococcus jostii]|uniref:DNA-binding transcriptional regulator, AcrR family n=2 Tax=Rhodococcus jostii TaxID=132919 RepID=A0A1H5M256_RHOJO|nr:DNA-binding transcriptional regulator, AcrR family [Rhodococcus jostii]
MTYMSPTVDSLSIMKEARRPKDTPATTPRGESTKERIMQGAARVLAKRGYAATTLADIAKAAGVKAGSLYYYMENKEDLIRDLMTRGIVETHAYVEDAVQSLGQDATSQDRLGAAIAAHMRYMLTKNDIARASIRTLGQAPAEVQGPAIELHRSYGHYFSALIEDAKTDGFLAPDIDARVLRLLIIGAANWSTAWYQPTGAESADGIAELLVRMAFGDMLPREK